jgi:hypothetical protein
MPSLSPEQLTVVESPLNARLFLEGPAGSGKTTAGVERLLYLMAQGVPGDSILLLVPQRTLAEPYEAALRHPGVVAGGMTSAVTIGGLARRMLDLFWPLAAQPAGFAHPDEWPTFLTLETAQYSMARLVRPLLEQGYFESVTLDRNRLYSQVIDNLNKAAVVGFPHTEIGARLKGAWIGDAGQLRVYDDVQACASLFRQHCLEHNLLDFSLQLEGFRQHLWTNPLCREYLQRLYRHLIWDNLEEDIPVAHDLLAEWLPGFDSALLIYDQGAGFRVFLGADPASGARFKPLCEQALTFERSFVVSPEVSALQAGLSAALRPDLSPASMSPGPARTRNARKTAAPDPRLALEVKNHRFFPEMLDWVADEIERLVMEQGLPPGEIVVLAPFLSDALRYTLVDRLAAKKIPARSHRPSRALREEPAAECLLTLARVAHPAWKLPPERFDFAYALVQALEGMDLVRAQLLAEIVFRLKEGAAALSSFEQIKPETQERITFRLGSRYERLRQWIEDYQSKPPQELDHFLSRLFGELLAQPGYGFHASLDAGRVAANLVESVQKFRWAMGAELEAEDIPLGKEYLSMVRAGVIAAQYLGSWESKPDEAVFLAPAYTFLLSNHPVQVQFWLDVGSRGWSERLSQPLTHPFVLSRGWQTGRPWTDLEEVQASRDSLYRLATGLLHRCRGKVYLGLSELGEQGYEQRGPLLQAFNRWLQKLAAG